MEYTFDVDSWGGHFSVPCCVATEYLKTSDGDFIKVLLCILSLPARTVDSSKIASITGLSEDIVDDAVIHWTSLGVLKLVGKKESSEGFDLSKERSSVSVPTCTAESVKPKEKTIDRKIVVSYTTQELLEKAQQDSELQNLFDEIQSYVNKNINGRELGILTDLYEVYHYDVPTILIAAEYCNTIGKYSIQYLSTVLKNWYEQDLVTYDQVEAEIVRRTEYNTYESMVKRCFGLTNKLTSKQKELADKWKSWNIDESLLNIACEKCLNGTEGKLSFKYIDTVISSWASKGIKTPEQVKADDEKFSGRSGNFSASEKENSYSIEKIEEMAKNFVSLKGDKAQ